MPVPFIDLKRFAPGFLDEWNRKVAELSRDARFMGGGEISRLEETLSTDNQTRYAIACANGTDRRQPRQPT